MNASLKTTQPIGEFLGVRRHPTVVRLDDLGAADAEWITSSYHITDEVQAHLQALRHALARDHGCGLFLIGQYGAGKSHFLAYVSRRIGKLAPAGVEARPISLLNYRAETPLEDIVHENLGIGAGHRDRRKTWAELLDRFRPGVLLILDELSEFLRSKPDRASFNEDIRFLQFMGETAQGRRLWVLAAVQEQIEHVGDLDYGTYRKIKDRFPVRLILTRTHVKDLLREAVLIRKDGFENKVEGLIRSLQDALPDARAACEDLRSLYPIHPATLELLEEVRDRFSQARGVIDFAVTQLSGDPARGVAPFLERPWGSLLTPDHIIDHFRDLFEVQAEFVPMAQQLLPFYDRHLDELFDTKAQRDLAGRLIKLLMLVHLSPARENLSAREAAYWLLYGATRVDPERNIRIVERLLATLAERGRYVARRGSAYALNLEDDGSARVEKFLEREKAELRARDDVLFEALVPLLEGDDWNPFALPHDEWRKRTATWRFHDRVYWVRLGDGEASDPPPEGVAIAIRLPWGNRAPAFGAYTVVPQALESGEEHLELAVLGRARERTWSEDVTRRLDARFQSRFTFFKAQVRNAYANATLVSPDGMPDPAVRLATPTFEAWLDSVAVWALRRTYPSFETFAPSHGPLPLEAYRSFMRFASKGELGDYESDELMGVIREGYLVPMRLMKRKGRGYVTPERLEKNELVQLLLDTLAYEPAPKVIYEHLGNPLYGLVPDQVSLLLVYLVILGEIDLIKGTKSYRDTFETLPNPIQYDKVVRGSGLTVDQLRQLETLCEAFRLRTPRQWTVLAQRRMIRELQELADSRRLELQRLALKLEPVEQAAELVDRLKATIDKWSVLLDGGDELDAFRQFLYEAKRVERFVSDVGEFERLGPRLERLLASIQRYRHLLGDPTLARWPDETVVVRLEALGEPPGLDRPDAVERWLERAGECYEGYKESYRSRHDRYWKAVTGHSVWTWRAPAVARSRHVGVAPEMQELDACRRRLNESRCRKLVDLDFQAVCTCGFDGEKSPIDAELDQAGVLVDKIDQAVRGFFGQKRIRERMRRWVEEGFETGAETLAYVDGRESLPVVSDVSSLDRYLAGVDLVKDVDSERVLTLLTERTWEPGELADAFRKLLMREGSGRLRFSPPGRDDASGSEGVASWCAEQALRFGVRLPGGLGKSTLESMTDAIQPEWVSESALDRLEDLGLPSRAEDAIVGWVLSGGVRAPGRSVRSPLAAAALEVLDPHDPETPEDLARLSRLLYRGHERLRSIEPGAWLERLERLAEAPGLKGLARLTEILAEHTDAQWLMLDAFGLPFLEPVRENLPELLPAWIVDGAASFGLMSERTTTDACYREIVEAGINTPFEKLNCLDALLHERREPFDDLCRIAVAELGASCRAIRERLDPGKPLVVFGDHGFRIAPDGSSYVHGGSSLLERVVPLLRMKPVGR